MKAQPYKSIILLKACLLWIIAIFVFSPHYISSGNVLEAWAISKGMILYKEIASFHFFLGRVPSLVLYTLTNWDLTLSPLLGLFIGILNLFILYKFAKKYFSDSVVSISIVFFSTLYWFYATSVAYYHEQLIGLFLTICLYFLFDFIINKTTSLRNIFIVGLFASLAEMSGQVASLSVIPIYLIFFVLIIARNRHKTKNVLKNSAALILGGLLPVIPSVIYFVSKHALWDFVNWNVTYYLDYANTTTNLADLPYFAILVFYLPLISLTLRFVLESASSKIVDTKNLVLLILGYTTIPFTVFSVFHFHHFTYSLPVITIILGFAFSNVKLSNIKMTIHKTATLISMFLFLVYFLSTIVPWHFDRLVLPDFSIKNDIKSTDSDAQVVSWLKENTNKESRILVIGNAMIYVRSDRLPSTRPAHSIPYSWVPFEKVKGEIEKNPADYIITDSSFTRRLVEDYRREDMYDFIFGLIKKCHNMIYSFDTWKIWKNSCD